MQFTVTQRVSCGITIPDGKSLIISNFTFLPDFEGEHQVRHIQTIVDASTKEEATKKAGTLFNGFLSKLTLIDNSKYVLDDELFVAEVEGSGTTTHTKSISGKVSIIKDGNTIKNIYEQSIIKRKLRIRPLRLYREAINASNIFERYRNFYRVIECYGNATNWIQNHIKKPIMKAYLHKGRLQKVTIITWLRHRISHSKHKEGVEPLLISNPQHISLVQKYLPKIQELAREKIKERERV